MHNRIPHRALAGLLAAALLPVSARAITPVAANGQLKVCGTMLCNEKGAPIQLRGVSLHGIQWFYNGFYKNGNALAAMAKWGADITRIPVYSDTLLPPECDKFNADGYLGSRYMKGFPSVQEGFKTLVDRYIEQADSLGMYALVDWHLHFPGNPYKVASTAEEFFDYISKKHGHRTNVLYEIVNEPSRHSGTCPNARNPAPDCFWKECIKPYAERIITAIRKNDPDGVVVVGTTCWSSFGLKCVNNPAAGAPPEDGPRYPGEFEETVANRLSDPNTMYTVHTYSGDRKWKASKIDDMAARLPIFLTEWAAQNSASFADSTKADNNWPESREILDIATRRKVSWIYWNLSPGKYMAVFKEKTPTNPTPANLTPTGGYTTIEGDSVYTWLNNPPDDFPSAAAVPFTSRRRVAITPSLAYDGNGSLVFEGPSGPAFVRVYGSDGRKAASIPGQPGPAGDSWTYRTRELAAGSYIVQFRNGSREERYPFRVGAAR